MFWKAASHFRAVAVLQATLRSKGTQLMAVAEGKWCSMGLRGKPRLG